ncbi:MAG: hypothetical protein Q7S13_06810 [Candidatus Omnitrophota bacterium]|nr:hypothetical protein [Candidatus Omnitrophota bacterium]
MNLPIGQWSGSDATNALHNTIRRSNRQTVFFVGLNIGFTILALVLSLLQWRYPRQTDPQADTAATNKAPQVAEAPSSSPTEKNLELEALYKKSLRLPEHNTVCFPAKKLLCNSSGCETVEPKIFNLITADSANPALIPSLSRCDSKGCDQYDARFEPSGLFVNVQPLNPNGMMFKASLSDLKYVEVVTIGLDTHISYGYCSSIK